MSDFLSSFDDVFAEVRGASSGNVISVRPVAKTPVVVHNPKLGVKKRAKSFGKAFTSTCMVIIVGAVTVGMNVPANVVFATQGGVSESDLYEPVNAHPKLQLPSQSVDAPVAVTAPTVIRDGYTVYVPPPPPPPPPVRVLPDKSLFNLSDAFTNNVDGTVQWPFAYGVRFSDGYGSRVSPCDGCSSDHQGQDFDAGNGALIQAIADGKVIAVEHYPTGLGNHVKISHVIDGVKVVSVYAHMQDDSITVKVGDDVKVGQILGLVGTTGSSTGPHLHLEIIVEGSHVDPKAWLFANAN